MCDSIPTKVMVLACDGQAEDIHEKEQEDGYLRAGHLPHAY